MTRNKKKLIFIIIGVVVVVFAGVFIVTGQETIESELPIDNKQSGVLIAPAAFLPKNAAPGLKGHTDVMDLLTDNGMNLFGWSIENWKELAPSSGTINLQDGLINPLTLLLPKYPQVKGVVFVLKMIDTNERRMPPDLKTKPFDDPEVLQRFEELIDAIASEPSSKRITHILLGNEVDGYLSQHPEELKAFSTFYQRAIERIHTKMPGVKVSTIMTFEGIRSHPRIFDELSQFSDFITYTYYPVAGLMCGNVAAGWRMKPISEIEADLEFLAKRAKNKQFAFTEIGYSSSPLNGASEELQAEFVREMFRVLDPYQKKGQIDFLLYHAMYDYAPDVCSPYAKEQGIPPDEICSFMENLGLRSWETGEPRKAWYAFVEGAKCWLEGKGLPATWAEAQSAQNSPRDAATGIRAKIEEFHLKAARWQNKGRDLKPLEEIMQEFEPLIQQERIKEAEDLLDKALALLNKQEATTDQSSLPLSLQKNMQEKTEMRLTIGYLNSHLLLEAWDAPVAKVERKTMLMEKNAPGWIQAGGDPEKIQQKMKKFQEHMGRRDFFAAEKAVDEALALMGVSSDPNETEWKQITREYLKQELDGFIKNAQKDGASSVEDSIGWAVVEPEEGKWDWTVYKDTAQFLHKNGLKYIPYIYFPNIPKWVREDSSVTMARCLEHGLSTEYLSIFSEKTAEFYERFFAEMKKALGSEIDAFRVGSPNGFGEIHYPAGAASWAFPVKHIHPDFWVGEPEAKRHFRKAMKQRYASIEKANRIWGTSFDSFDDAEYPKDISNKRKWLDFIGWYHDALTEKMGELLDIVKKHFPDTPLMVSIGWPFEKINLGQDISGLVQMAASKGINLRGPTGPSVPFIYTKHIATSVQYYQLPVFSSEPADSTAPLEEMSLAFFKDLTTGVDWHFDYHDNLERASKQFAWFRKMPLGRYPLVDTAIFFPTTSHRLDNWDSWRKEGFAGGFPEGLMPFAEDLRDILDYDVVDEQLITDNALSSYKLLLWPVGDTIEAVTLKKIRGWIEKGGILLVKDLESIKTVEGDKGVFAELIKLPKTGNMIRVDDGYIFDCQGQLEKLTQLIINRADTKGINPAYPSQLSHLPPLDITEDGILVSLFEDGILLFNRNETAVTKELSLPKGSWKITYKNLPKTVELPSLEMRWLDGKTGEVK